jgi:type I restriction enzyme S subunit
MIHLSEICYVFNGKTPSKLEQRGTGHPVLKIKDIDEEGNFRGKIESFVEIELASKFKQKLIKKNDILILNAAHNSDYVATKMYFAGTETENILPTGEWTLVRANEEKIIPAFLYFWFQTAKTRKLIKEIVKGIHLYPKDVASLKINLPTLEEQRRITEVLEKANSVRKKRKQINKKLDKLLQSGFLELFSKNNSDYGKWPIFSINELASPDKGSMRTGPFGSDLLHSEFVDEGICVIGIDNAVKNKFEWKEKRFITPEKFEKLKRYTLHPRDVIITIMGTTGRSAVVPDDIPLSINSKHLAAITLNKLEANPYFISYSIHSDPFILNQIKKNNKGAIMEGLNLGIIKELKIRKPPIELQNKFEEFYWKIDNLKNKSIKSELKLENLFDSLMQQAFNGELKFSEIEADIEKQLAEV